MESSSPWWSFLTVSNANSVLSSSHRNQNISIIVSSDFFFFSFMIDVSLTIQHTFKAVSVQTGAQSDSLSELSIFSSLLSRRAPLCVRG